jgi:hypothetical protein
MVLPAQPLGAAERQSANARIAIGDRINYVLNASRNRLEDGVAQEHSDQGLAESIGEPTAANAMAASSPTEDRNWVSQQTLATFLYRRTY